MGVGVGWGGKLGQQEASLPGHLKGWSRGRRAAGPAENRAGPRASRRDAWEPQGSCEPTQELRMERNEQHLGKH